MHIDHIALYTQDIEMMKSFYEKYLGGKPGTLYINPRTGFSSYFLSFETGARIELMHRADIPPTLNDPYQQFTGYIHLSFSAASREAVDALTLRLQEAGCPLLDGPRQTGDGYYESVLLDPEGNRIEIIA
jgi:lactoylglutathione lyase